MEQLLTDLIRTLTEEKEIYRAMLTLSIEKKGIVEAGNVDQLSLLNRQERELLKKAKQQENQRSMVLHAMGCLDQSGNVQLEQIINKLEGKAHDQLVHIREEFQFVLGELMKYNEINKRLIQSQLDYTDFCMHLVSQMSSSGTYNQSGAVSANKGDVVSLFDQKI